MTDPFAAVQVRQPSAPNGHAGPQTDPFTNANQVDDPFAVSSDLKGGAYTPTPPMEVLHGRLVVMIPRSFDPAAKDPRDESKTRELYTVDLTVFTGGEMKWLRTIRGDRSKGEMDRKELFTVENVSPENPFTVNGAWVSQGNIVGKLKACHEGGNPYLGVVDMGPTASQRKAGKTAADIKADFKQWVDLGKLGDKPTFAWMVVDPTPEQRAIAVAWWGRVRSTIAPIVPTKV